ncbi:MAG: WD40 repeat domain-containing protein, partial [Aliihoeflea sp.]
TAVAFHPTEEILAIGYGDGMVMVVRVADAKEVLLRRPGQGAITSMDWDREGRRIAFGSQTGECGVIDVAG